MKIVEVLYNKSYGGFALSDQAVETLNHTYGWNKSASETAELRHDPRLISLFKEKGSKWMSGECSDIEIIEIEADGYRITDYDGKETVEECYVDFVLI